MSGDSGALAGATARPIDCAVSIARTALPNGSRAALVAVSSATVGHRRAIPSQRRAVWATESRINARPSNESRRGSPGVASGSNTAAARRSRSRSTSRPRSSTPPTPSVTEWCTFITTAARPPSKPSTTNVSHRGRARSKLDCAIGPTKSRSCRSLPGAGTTMRRRWKSTSKSGSFAQRGGAIRNGGASTRWRRRGIVWLACS